jgi:hypothetical protein
MYYSNIAVKESSLKDSMKFYHMVLKEDQRNIYAANGLGMVCAAKEQNEIAREIFSRVILRCVFYGHFPRCGKLGCLQPVMFVLIWVICT